MHRSAAAFVAAVGYLVLFVVGVLWFIPRMEDDLTERAEIDLAAQGSSDLAVSFDGRNGRLEGSGSEAAADRLDGDLRGARWVRGDDGGSDGADSSDEEEATSTTDLTVATTTSTAPASDTAASDTPTAEDPSEAEPVQVVANRDGDVVVLEGIVGSEDDRQQLVSEAMRKGFRVDDRLTVDPTVASGSDAPVSAAVPILGAILGGSEDGALEIDGDSIVVSATADDVVEAESIEAAIGEAESAGVTVEADISTLELSEDEQIVALETEIDQIFELARRIQIESPNFATSQDELSVGAVNILDRVSVAIRRYPLPMVEVVGHADSRGSDAENQSLSEARATTALDYLAANGVDSSRLTASGRGEAEPESTNATAEGRLENRRVNFAVRKREG